MRQRNEGLESFFQAGGESGSVKKEESRIWIPLKNIHGCVDQEQDLITSVMATKILRRIGIRTVDS